MLGKFGQTKADGVFSVTVIDIWCMSFKLVTTSSILPEASLTARTTAPRGYIRELAFENKPKYDPEIADSAAVRRLVAISGSAPSIRTESILKKDTLESHDKVNAPPAKITIAMINTQITFLRLCSTYDADWRVRRLSCILFVDYDGCGADNVLAKIFD